jgi:hypothetical protein
MFESGGHGGSVHPGRLATGIGEAGGAQQPRPRPQDSSYHWLRLAECWTKRRSHFVVSCQPHHHSNHSCSSNVYLDDWSTRQNRCRYNTCWMLSHYFRLLCDLQRDLGLDLPLSRRFCSRFTQLLIQIQRPQRGQPYQLLPVQVCFSLLWYTRSYVSQNKDIGIDKLSLCQLMSH